MKKMYVEPMGGLGNRMNCIISAIVDSRKYGFDLMIVWNVDQGCAIKFTDLMEPIENVKFIQLSKMGYKRVTGSLTLFNNVYTRLLMKHCEKKVSESFVQQNFVNDNTTKERIYDAQSIYIKSWSGWVDQEAFDLVRHMFIPKPLYIEKLGTIFDGIEKNRLYGFHIRRTDHIKSIQNCPTELFVNKMEELIKKDANAKFYLATDDFNLEQELNKKYNDNIVKRLPFCQQVKRDSKDGMMDAYVDILCLAHCKVIYGSDSTFSTLASYLGNTELIILKNKK